MPPVPRLAGNRRSSLHPPAAAPTASPPTKSRAPGHPTNCAPRRSAARCCAPAILQRLPPPPAPRSPPSPNPALLATSADVHALHGPPHENVRAHARAHAHGDRASRRPRTLARRRGCDSGFPSLAIVPARPPASRPSSLLLGSLTTPPRESFDAPLHRCEYQWSPAPSAFLRLSPFAFRSKHNVQQQ